MTQTGPHPSTRASTWRRLRYRATAIPVLALATCLLGADRPASPLTSSVWSASAGTVTATLTTATDEIAADAPTAETPAADSPYMQSDAFRADLFTSAPLYLDGGRRIAVASFGQGKPSTSASFLPGGGRIFVKAFGGCQTDLPSGVTLHVVATLNDVTIDQASCSHGSGQAIATDPGIDDPDSDYSTIGAHRGEESILSASVEVSPAVTRIPSGSYAIYEQIPFSQVPVPPAPAHVPPLPAQGRNPLLLDSRTHEATGAWFVTARVGATLELVRAAPGELTVSYEGRQIGDAVGYDWQADSELVTLDGNTLGCGCGGRPPLGTTVRLTVHASGFTRRLWYVEDRQVADPVPRGVIILDCPATQGSCRQSTSLAYPSASPAT